MTAIATAVPTDIVTMIKARVKSVLHYCDAEPAIGQVWMMKEPVLQDSITGEKTTPVVFLCEESNRLHSPLTVWKNWNHIIFVVKNQFRWMTLCDPQHLLMIEFCLR